MPRGVVPTSKPAVAAACRQLIRVACLLLAAGGATRFGGCKQLAPIDGTPMVRHCIHGLLPRFGNDLFTLLGAYLDEVRPVVEDLSQIVENPDWRDGIGASIAAGIRAVDARARYDGVLITLADQVGLRGVDFDKLLQVFDAQSIVAAHYADELGVPAVFPRSMFAQLKRLSGDRGAKSILRQRQTEVVSVPLPAAALDVDCVADIPRR